MKYTRTLFLLLVGLVGCSFNSSPTLSQLEPVDWSPGINQVAFPEPSGAVYHPHRETIFVVGDEGYIGEVTTEGILLEQVYLRPGDFEGITTDPGSGLLYVAVEGEEKILEINPESLELQREILIERSFEDTTLLLEGGEGVESITFVPEQSSGYFFLTNQNRVSGREVPDPSVLIKVEVNLADETSPDLIGQITEVSYPDIPDMSGLQYDADDGHLFVVSDTNDRLYKVTTTGEILTNSMLPGQDQEGFTVDANGFFYIAQDSGTIIKAASTRE